MKKILLDEAPLLLLPTLATKLGVNEAIVLQQLHFRLLHSPLKEDGHIWYHHTYTKWQNQFPFWSGKTISRIFLRLEEEGIIVSTQDYNTMKIDKTKWYRIDYGVLLHVLGCQIDLTTPQKWLAPTEQMTFKEEVNMPPSDLKDVIQEEKKKDGSSHQDVISAIIDYLNQKANKAFRITNKATQRLIHARLKEGYQLKDFQKVIDLKVRQWQNNPNMQQYIRPSTLFSPTNFENYLNETNDAQTLQEKRSLTPIVLDFEAGEEE